LRTRRMAHAQRRRHNTQLPHRRPGGHARAVPIGVSSQGKEGFTIAARLCQAPRQGLAGRDKSSMPRTQPGENPLRIGDRVATWRDPVWRPADGDPGGRPLLDPARCGRRLELHPRPC
jgi:hypothetical protein